MQSKPEIQILNILNDRFGSSVYYQHSTIYGNKYSLLVDYTIQLTPTHLIHLEYSGMNYFRKYLKLVDVTVTNPVYTIFDNEKLIPALTYFIDNIDTPNILRDESLLKITERIDSFYREIGTLLNFR